MYKMLRNVKDRPKTQKWSSLEVITRYKTAFKLWKYRPKLKKLVMKAKQPDKQNRLK